MTNQRGIANITRGDFTPVFTFATPGDLVATASASHGHYVKIGELVYIDVNVTLSTFTHSTASGGARITGLPFTSLDEAGARVLHLDMQGWTAAGLLPIAAVKRNDTIIQFFTWGSGVSYGDLDPSKMPSGGSVDIYISGHYIAA